ncbi:MAG: PH domain-containing protein [Bacteroidota bacterium]
MGKYSTSRDALAGYIMPAGLLLLTGGMVALQAVVAHKNGRNIPMFLYAVPLVILPIIIGIAYVLRPREIETDEEKLTIVKRYPVTIYYKDIKAVRQLDPEELKRSLRTFGNGGLFGYTGKYYKKPFGSMTWYCTQRDNYVLIELHNEKKIVVTPDTPQDLVLEIKSHLP